MQNAFASSNEKIANKLDPKVAIRRFANHLIATKQTGFEGAAKLRGALYRLGFLTTAETRTTPLEALRDGMRLVASGTSIKEALNQKKDTDRWDTRETTDKYGLGRRETNVPTQFQLNRYHDHDGN